jgi:alpha-glucosidase
VPGHEGWWYLHLFDPTQPDLNWENPEVRADFEATLRFWFDLGVDGLRIDVAHTLIKAPGYPDAAEGLQGPVPGTGTDATPQSDQPRVHEVWRSWRRLADTYDPPRVFVGEAWVSTPEAQAAYTRPDELHTTFNFHFLLAWWDAARIREVVSTSIASAAAVGAPATWVLSNHDVWRPVSRFAPVRSDQSRDLEVGRRRALALSMLSLALPGSAYLYQGEELGLEEVLDLPDHARRDPKFLRTGGADLGRDGCRVPIPWSGSAPPFGFSTGSPWLPQPAQWSAFTAEAEAADETSTLSTYRHALRVRRGLAALGDGELEWLDGEAEGVIALLRPGSPGVLVLLNTGAGEAVSARPGEVLVESGGVLREDASVLRLPPDSICWLSAT